jgi:hypothetical protein
MAGEVLGTAIEPAAAFTLFTLLGRARFNRRRFRGMVGPGTAGVVYDRLNADQRRAVELFVEQRTADRDPETADGTPDDADPLGGLHERRID